MMSMNQFTHNDLKNMTKKRKEFIIYIRSLDPDTKGNDPNENLAETLSQKDLFYSDIK